MAVEKRALYKVYDSSGNYITTWADEVTSKPTFTWGLNSSMGEMVIVLARNIQSFGESDDVALLNRVDTYIQDGDNPLGVCIHSGQLTGYEIIVDKNGLQQIEIHVLSNTIEFQKTMLKDGGGNTTVSYSSKDPSAIVKSLLNYAGKTITYNAASVEDTDTSVDYDFRYMTFWEGLKKAVSLCPGYWYFYVDGNNIFHLSSLDTSSVDHSLYIGKHINNVRIYKTTENMYNSVYFLGGGSPNLYYLYQTNGSVTEYGALETRIQDMRVTVQETSDTISLKYLYENDHFEQEATIEIMDNNSVDEPLDGGIKGYDIESFRPGQIVTITAPEVEVEFTKWYNDAETLGNFVWDVSFWDNDILFSLGIPLQIKEINYNFNSCSLVLSTLFGDISDRILGTDEKVDDVASENIPNAPS